MKLTLSLVASLLAVSCGLAGAAQTPTRSRTFRFHYRTVVNDVPHGSGALEVWLPYPQSTEHQAIHSVTLAAPGPITISQEPRQGNQAAYFRQERPSGPVEITMEIVATRLENAGTREELNAAERAEYLSAEPLVPTDGPVKALAVEATRGKKGAAAKARAIYEKVTGMMKYDKSGTGWGRGDAIWACDAKRGNCTDFHALIIGMARSQGIPARFAMGVPLPEERGQGEIPGYHCWAELYVDGEWVPIDSSEAAKAVALGQREKKDYFFGHHDENRLEFSRGRHLTLAPAQKSGPLNYFVYPHVEIGGKKHEAVKRKFTFTDLSATQAAVR
ncbi:MAG: transglutaminase-like domain-containing protein [Armatimonadota bacterium]